MHKAVVENVTIDRANNLPVISLKLLDYDDKRLPIHIGTFEASAIVAAIQKIKFDRPMTHDLFRNFIAEINISVAKAAIVDIRNNTYYAKLYFMLKDRILDIDARPSDAIAMALRFDAPIFVEQAVIDKSNLTENYQILDTSEQGKQWAKYIQSLSNEKFWKV